ncbi:MAG: hypothetical protein QOH32_771 [Bradyrhizobium sp.]|nr:hypothetical protein [Bradyrhizobium sp.]
MTSGPATGLCLRVSFLRAALSCLALIGLHDAQARAQTLTSDLLRPVRDGFVSPQDLPLRRTAPSGTEDRSDGPRDPNAPAPSRIGNLPTWGQPAASGASASGYDSLNRKRQKPKFYPGQRKPKVVGPGNPPPAALAPDPKLPPPKLPQPPSASAHRTPLPPAAAGTVPGQPYRRQLRIDDDPFGPVGDYFGSFLVKTAVEFMGGYDSNPGRTNVPRGSPLYVVAPELLVVSDWERHALVADLRGSFTGYTETFPNPPGVVSTAPTNVDRPDFTGHVDGRLDVTRDTRLLGQLRLRVATDNPGSPNIQAGLAKYPIYTTLGGTFGVDQNFNRLQVSAGATVDSTTYQHSVLTDGSIASNDDRNFNAYGGIARVSYEVMPGLKPFGEIQGDTRVHELKLDRAGYARDSNGGYIKAGTSFEFTRLLTGDVSLGWAERSYSDARLNRLQGLLTSASLVWAATPLTTAKFISDTAIGETTLPGVSGVLTHTYTFEVDHDFRRWLTAVGKFTFGTAAYQGDARFDHLYSISGDLIYKLNRDLWVKGTVRRDILDSNQFGSSSASTVVMLGVRLQR